MKILLLSAYDTASHQAWCKGLMKHLPQINWTYLSLPGRYFSWRIRGNALSWAFGKDRRHFETHYDLVIATSMVDLASLRGLLPTLATTPCIMYFHENQFTYPKSAQQHASIEPQMVNLYGALSAETVLFNSQYNHDSFMLNAKKLLKKLPDHAPISAIDHIQTKSRVLPVPISLPENPQPTEVTQPLKVIWNHRWEYDKGPDLLLEVIAQLQTLELPIRFTIAGLSFRSKPESMQKIIDHEFECVEHIGTFESKQDYLQALENNHVVLSTAIHEFQGLAVLEGAAYGCVPLAPNRLAYPEWIPQHCLYQEGDTLQQEAQFIVNKLQTWCLEGVPQPLDITSYDWETLSQSYLEIIQLTAETQT